VPHLTGEFVAGHLRHHQIDHEQVERALLLDVSFRPACVN